METWLKPILYLYCIAMNFEIPCIYFLFEFLAFILFKFCNGGSCSLTRFQSLFPVYIYVLLSSFWQELYESIRDEPFKIPEDDGNDLTKTFFNAEREGMLTKEGRHILL